MARERLEDARRGVADGVAPPPLEVLVEDVCATAARLLAPAPAPVINATGVVLHTNLGRAPLSAAAVEAVARVTSSYSDLELNLEEGARGSRQAHVSGILRHLTGAEAGLVVNNNASAVLLALSAIAYGKEVIVSRGEAVEIGGGFRIPDVLSRSGAVLREVGTTNRTYAADYEDAICSDTGALLKVHSSNFVITGFTHETTIGELVEMGARHGVPVIHDLGSGCLLDTSRFGLAHEPMVQESVDAGVDLACFSGDKLLGGPQAGIIVGRAGYGDAPGRSPPCAGHANRQAQPGGTHVHAGPLPEGPGRGGDTRVANDRRAARRPGGGGPPAAGRRRRHGPRRAGPVDGRRWKPARRDASDVAAYDRRRRRA